MKYTLQIHLEYKEDIIRDIDIASTNNLEDLHFAIINAFELDKNEMASFYMTNEDFELLQEIPLFGVEDKQNPMLAMSEITLSSILTKEGSQLLYIYDFMKMWRFLITLNKTSDETISSSKCTNKIGEMPKDAPEITFEAEKEFDPFEDAFDDFDEFNEHEEY